MKSKSAGGKLDWHARFLQQAAWTRPLRSYLFERAGLERARRVLEVGCGTGAILEDLETPATVFGLDLDLARLGQAKVHAARAALACADGLHLPFPDGTFDICFCHFLLLWLGQPLEALLEMHRVTRPGGYILALAEPDYADRLDEPSELAPLGRFQADSLRSQGAQPDLGKRLATLFRQAGLRIIETGRLEENRQGRPSRRERELEWAVLESDLAGSVPELELHRLKKLDELAWERGERRLSVPTYFAWGEVPPMV